ncbi:MAG: septation protein IspZ [Pseudomonadales bacterium]|nr:septation protein IspZ [Pseudomonadales bacterium]
MQQILELVPILLFFISYAQDGQTWELFNYSHTFNGIYSATAVLMIATVIQVLLTVVITKKLEKRLILLAAVVLITGSLTLILKNNIFIQWKPTLFNWVLAIVFLLAPFFGEKKTLMERMLDNQLQLPKLIWHRVNYLWVTNFIIVGTLNLVVAYSFSEAFWVSYKLYSSIGFTLLISILTAIIITPYIKDESANESKD